MRCKRSNVCRIADEIKKSFVLHEEQAGVTSLYIRRDARIYGEVALSCYSR
jgi:hypothetical protein